MSQIPVVTVTFTVPRDPAVFERDHRRALTVANEAAAVHHHEVHIPRHFEGFAPAKYGYPKRSQKYEKRKQRQYGHKQPLVYSGNTKQQVTNHRNIKPNYKRALLILKIPIRTKSGRTLDAAARKRLGLSAPTFRQLNVVEQVMKRVAEIEAITPDEVRTLSRVVERVYTAEINKPNVPRRVRFRTR